MAVLDMDITNETIQRTLDRDDLDGLLRKGAGRNAYQVEAEIIGSLLRSSPGTWAEPLVTAVVAAAFFQIFTPLAHAGRRHERRRTRGSRDGSAGA